MWSVTAIDKTMCTTSRLPTPTALAVVTQIVRPGARVTTVMESVTFTDTLETTIAPMTAIGMKTCVKPRQTTRIIRVRTTPTVAREMSHARTMAIATR